MAEPAAQHTPFSHFRPLPQVPCPEPLQELPVVPCATQVLPEQV